MEILNSGSFVTLDNREKIDQLIYTARELASEVARTDGFQNSGQTNHQLGLEMWKGAEYVSRAHEEANIRNLFLSKFLERLREIEKERIVHARPAPTNAVYTVPAPQPEPLPVSVMPQQRPELPAPQLVADPPPQTVAQDEYLGVVTAEESSEDKQVSYADECLPDYDAGIEALVDRLESEDPELAAVEQSNQIGTEREQHEISATVELAESVDQPSAAIEEDASIEVSENDVSAEDVQSDVPESVDAESIRSIVLADKEPYNFGGCTVTAVIQLLPEAEGVRKCVVSVRTHDFTPQISIVNMGTTDGLPQISAALGSAFEQYRNDLPARAAEKMKKEKPIKKQAKTSSKSAKASADQSKTAASSATTAAAAVPTGETGQGGLFGS